MTVDWTGCDGFDWAGASQSPMTAAEREVVIDFAADLLALDATDRGREWGAASPPGRFAATVICVRPNVSHRYRSMMQSAAVGQIGVKVLKANADAAREAERCDSLTSIRLPLTRTRFCKRRASGRSATRGGRPRWPRPHVRPAGAEGG